MAHCKQLLAGNDDSTYVLKFKGQNVEPRCLQLHYGMFIYIAKQHNIPMKMFQDIVEMTSSDKSEQLQDLLSEVAKHVKIALTIPVPP